MNYTHHEKKFQLSTGQDVYWNRISGYAVEVDHTYLCIPTRKQSLEIAQTVACDDCSFADECEVDKVASLHQTDMW